MNAVASRVTNQFYIDKSVLYPLWYFNPPVKSTAIFVFLFKFNDVTCLRHFLSRYRAFYRIYSYKRRYAPRTNSFQHLAGQPVQEQAACRILKVQGQRCRPMRGSKVITWEALISRYLLTESCIPLTRWDHCVILDANDFPILQLVIGNNDVQMIQSGNPPKWKPSSNYTT